MGDIIIGGITVDTEDIDLLVRHKPLAELDNLVKDDEIIYKAEKTPYWKHRLETHRIARDIAEWMFYNGIPTVDLPKETRDRTQGLFALEMCRDFEKRLNSIESYLKRKQDNASNRKTNRYKDKYIL